MFSESGLISPFLFLSWQKGGRELLASSDPFKEKQSPVFIKTHAVGFTLQRKSDEMQGSLPSQTGQTSLKGRGITESTSELDTS